MSLQHTIAQEFLLTGCSAAGGFAPHDNGDAKQTAGQQPQGAGFVDRGRQYCIPDTRSASNVELDKDVAAHADIRGQQKGPHIRRTGARLINHFAIRVDAGLGHIEAERIEQGAKGASKAGIDRQTVAGNRTIVGGSRAGRTAGEPQSLLRPGRIEYFERCSDARRTRIPAAVVWTRIPRAAPAARRSATGFWSGVKTGALSRAALVWGRASAAQGCRFSWGRNERGRELTTLAEPRPATAARVVQIGYLALARGGTCVSALYLSYPSLPHD
jgi:hypothetical protein